VLHDLAFNRGGVQLAKLGEGEREILLQHVAAGAVQLAGLVGEGDAGDFVDLESARRAADFELHLVLADF
jgi:hypothetical protein